jgi:hypothetical protein
MIRWSTFGDPLQVLQLLIILGKGILEYEKIKDIVLNDWIRCIEFLQLVEDKKYTFAVACEDKNCRIFEYLLTDNSI